MIENQPQKKNEGEYRRHRRRFKLGDAAMVGYIAGGLITLGSFTHVLYQEAKYWNLNPKDSSELVRQSGAPPSPLYDERTVLGVLLGFSISNVSGVCGIIGLREEEKEE